MGQNIQTNLSSYSTADTLGIDTVMAVLKKYCTGLKCLDVGCGILPRPAYMIEGIEWTGIDPQGGKREFEFIQADGENIPFNDDTFDAILFATSIDHLKDPAQTITEVRGVLKPGGYVIIWLTLRPVKKYLKWVKGGGWYNELHPQAFTEDSLIKLMSGFDLIEKINIKWGVNIFVFQK